MIFLFLIYLSSKEVKKILNTCHGPSVSGLNYPTLSETPLRLPPTFAAQSYTRV